MDAHLAVSEPATRRRSRVLSAAVVLAVAGSIAAAASGAPTSSPLNLQGKDVRTGKPVSLAGDAGKPVVVNLWLSSCGACFADARALASFEHAHPAARVLGVDVADSTAGARSLSKRAGWQHPSIADPSGRIAAQLKMTTLPTTLFLNAKDEIVERINGQTTAVGFAAGYRKASA
jgi:thiol-disulfide isomerase/thioredoxin